MSTQNTLFDEKKQLRDRLKQMRAAITANERANYSKMIADRLLDRAEIQQANCIFAYISHANEVETHDLLKILLKTGKQLLVPKILDPTIMVAQPLNSWDDLHRGPFGILAPKETPSSELAIDVVITPGLGFTEQGHRMGLGAGYYDRWFAKNKVGKKIAIAFEAQLVESLPLEETDIPVDMIFTEERLITI